MPKMSLLRALSCALFVGACSPRSGPPPHVVPDVNLEKYAGKWFEIARLPNRFQKGCTATTATYTLKDDGHVNVVNECRKDTIDGKLKSISGIAKVADEATQAKLKVSFFWPFSGDYWIIDLADDYSYAAVGTPKRNNLWILSRSSKMETATYEKVVQRARKQGFAVDRLIKTQH